VNTVIMGVLNVTPDSFSDGGRYVETDVAIQHALDLVAQGADLIDVGGESTRPGAAAVAPEEEIRRVAPVIEQLAERAKSRPRLGENAVDIIRRMRDGEWD